MVFRHCPQEREALILSKRSIALTAFTLLAVMLGWFALAPDDVEGVVPEPGPGTEDEAPHKDDDIEGSSNSVEPVPTSPYGAGTTQQDSSTTIKGLVVSGQAQPVAGAVIELSEWPASESTQAEHPTAHSDMDGIFSITPLGRPHGISLTVIATGYLPATVRGVNAGEYVRIELHKGGTLRGEVTNGVEGVAGAQIRWIHSHVDRRIVRDTTSDQKGLFEFQSVALRGFLSVQAEGYSPVCLEVADADDEIVQIRLHRAGSLKGKVVDGESREAIEGAVVEAWMYRLPGSDGRGKIISPTQLLKRARTAGDGRFPLPILAAETNARIAVWVQSKGYAPIWHELRSHEKFVTLSLFKGTVITGKVIDTKGKPVANCIVRANSSIAPLCSAREGVSFRCLNDSRIGRSGLFGPIARDVAPFSSSHIAITDDDGRYRIGSVACGTGSAAVLTWPGWAEELAVTQVATVPATTMPPIVLPDAYTATARGKVLSAEGRTPITGAIVECAGVTAITDEQGRYGLVLPEWTARIDSKLWLRVRSRGYMTHDRAYSRRDLSDTEIVTELRRANPVDGRVVDAHGAPVPAAHVMFFSGGNESATEVAAVEVLTAVSGEGPGRNYVKQVAYARTNAAGEFMCNNVPDVAFAFVRYPNRFDGPFSSQLVRCTATRPSGSPLILRLRHLNLGAAHKCSLLVHLSAQGPQLDRKLVVESAGVEIAEQHVRAAEAEFHDLPTGKVTVVLCASGAPQVRVDTTLEPGNNELRIRIPSGIRIEGSVVTPNGPLGGLSVVVVLSDRSDRMVATSRVTPEGRYQFNGIAPGEYELEIGGREYSSNVLSPWHSPVATERPVSLTVREGDSLLHRTIPVVTTMPTRCEIPITLLDRLGRQVEVRIRDASGHTWFAGRPERTKKSTARVSVRLPHGEYTAILVGSQGARRYPLSAGSAFLFE